MLFQYRSGHKDAVGYAESIHQPIFTWSGTDTSTLLPPEHPHCTILPNTHLGVSDQFHSTSLVGSEAHNFADDTVDDGLALGLTALSARGTGSRDTTLGLVAAVDTPDETGALDCVDLVVGMTTTACHC